MIALNTGYEEVNLDLVTRPLLLIWTVNGELDLQADSLAYQVFVRPRGVNAGDRGLVEATLELIRLHLKCRFAALECQWWPYGGCEEDRYKKH